MNEIGGVTCADLDRFWAKVIPDGDCLRWTGASIKHGYGMLWLNGKARLAHVIAYTVFVGPYPEPVLDHQCNNPWCVNWDHLKPATIQKNVLRGVGRGAMQARQTHCKRGHEFTPENTIWEGNRRHCRECVKLRSTGTSRGWR